MRRIFQRHQEKINYLLVGGWNTVFGYLAFVALYLLLAKQIHYLILLVLANILSITNAYLGYKIFVFKTKGNYVREYLRFYLVYGATLLLNLLFLPICVNFLGISPVLAQGGFIFVNVIFSYLGHKYFSFGGTR